MSLLETLWPGTFWPETFWADTELSMLYFKNPSNNTLSTALNSLDIIVI